jgi:hypothetical protein
MIPELQIKKNQIEALAYSYRQNTKNGDFFHTIEDVNY